MLNFLYNVSKNIEENIYLKWRYKNGQEDFRTELLQSMTKDIKELKINQEKLIREVEEIIERFDDIEEKINRTLTGAKKLTYHFFEEKI